MTNRTLLVLAGALVIFGALAVLGQREQQPVGTGTALLFPDLQEQLDEVIFMTLVCSGW